MTEKKRGFLKKLLGRQPSAEELTENTQAYVSESMRSFGRFAIQQAEERQAQWNQLSPEEQKALLEERQREFEEEEKRDGYIATNGIKGLFEYYGVGPETVAKYWDYKQAADRYFAKKHWEYKKGKVLRDEMSVKFDAVQEDLEEKGLHVWALEKLVYEFNEKKGKRKK